MPPNLYRTHTQTHKPQVGEPLIKKMNIVLVDCIAVSLVDYHLRERGHCGRRGVSLGGEVPAPNGEGFW